MAEMWQSLLERLTGIPGPYLIDRDYRPYAESQNTHFLPVEIISGPWEGVAFSYENVQWHRLIASINDGEPQGERMVATYDIQVLSTGVKSARAPYSKRFKRVADEIWVDYSKFIIDNHNKIRQQVLTDDRDEDGTSDFEESITPRTIRKKGNSAPTSRIRTTQKRKTPPRNPD